MRSPLAIAVAVPLIALAPWAVGRVIGARLLADPESKPGQPPGTAPEAPARGLATFVCGASFVIITVIALGSAGWLAAGPFAAVMLAALAVAIAAGGGNAAGLSGKPFEGACRTTGGIRGILANAGAMPGFAVAIFALLSAGLVCAFVAWNGWRMPPLAYDALMYHLVFPAEWIERGRLALVPTVFAAPANSYFPANAEATFAAAMLATGDERLVNLAQFPFLIAAAAAVAGIARRWGASWPAALVSAALFAGAPEVATQAGSGLVDLDFAAGFLLALFFLLEYRATGSKGAIVLAGLSAGLLLGTKTLGIVFGGLLLPAAVLCVLERRDQGDDTWPALLLAGAAALPLGGFWYVRNWETTGNPLFPVEVKAFGRLLFPGVHGRAEMLKSHFHVPPLGAAAQALDRLWAPTVTIAGWIKIPLLLLPVAAALISAAPRLLHFERGRALRVYLLGLPWLMIAVHAWGNPYNTQYRFLLPAFGLSLVPLAVGATGGSGSRRLDRIGLVAAGTAALMLPAALIGFGPADPLDPRAEVFPFSWGIIAGTAAAGTGVILVLARRAARARRLEEEASAQDEATAPFHRVARGPWPDPPKPSAEKYRRLAWSLAAPAGVALLAALAALLHPLVAVDYLGLAGNERDGQRTVIWGRVRQDPAPRVIAYTGFNQPYPLYGEDLRNRVIYVAVDGRQGFNLHDYAKLADRPGGVKGVRSYKPAYERQQPSLDAWLAGLDTLGVERLVVSRFTSWDLEEYAHGPAGFPVEEKWARSMPWKFRPLAVTADMRLYEVVPEEAPRPTEPPGGSPKEPAR